jgi:hypothetical protein
MYLTSSSPSGFNVVQKYQDRGRVRVGLSRLSNPQVSINLVLGLVTCPQRPEQVPFNQQMTMITKILRITVSYFTLFIDN